MGIALSDFKPALTITMSGVMRTTVAVTIAPGRKRVPNWLSSNNCAKLSVIE